MWLNRCPYLLSISRRHSQSILSYHSRMNNHAQQGRTPSLCRTRPTNKELPFRPVLHSANSLHHTLLYRNQPIFTRTVNFSNCLLKQTKIAFEKSLNSWRKWVVLSFASSMEPSQNSSNPALVFFSAFSTYSHYKCSLRDGLQQFLIHPSTTNTVFFF